MDCRVLLMLGSIPCSKNVRMFMLIGSPSHLRERKRTMSRYALDNVCSFDRFVTLGNGRFLYARWVHPHPVSRGGRDCSHQGDPEARDRFLTAEPTE
jgi:hypothetical protein